MVLQDVMEVASSGADLGIPDAYLAADASALTEMVPKAAQDPLRRRSG